MADNCCRTNDDGSRVCIVADHETGCGSQADAVISVEAIPVSRRDSGWQKMRGGVLFGIACITSPCCTPLIVPVVLALLAGTPTAAWINAHVGGIYAVLTLISVASLVLALRLSGTMKTITRQSKVNKFSGYEAAAIVQPELSQGA